VLAEWVCVLFFSSCFDEGMFSLSLPLSPTSRSPDLLQHIISHIPSYIHHTPAGGKPLALSTTYIYIPMYLFDDDVFYLFLKKQKRILKS
jgi:hypothetical protein